MLGDNILQYSRAAGHKNECILMMWNSCPQEVYINSATDSTSDEVECPIKLVQDGAHTHNSLELV